MSPPNIPNAREVIRHFGGPINLVRLAAHHGIAPTPNREQAKKWSQRNSIPGDYVLGLVALGEMIGKPLLDTTHHGAKA